MEGGQPRKLIAFVIDELGKKFPLAADQPRPAVAPGTSGCAGAVLLLALALGGLALLAR